MDYKVVLSCVNRVSYYKQAQKRPRRSHNPRGQSSYRGAAMKSLPARDPRHGKPSTYTNLACRCDKCREAWTTYNRERREAKQVAA